MKRRALGKGLGALIPDLGEAEQEGKFAEVEVKKIVPNKFQPRKIFNNEKLDELVASIKAKGVIQPVIVRRSNSGYELIAGERRWQAALKAGLENIPVIIRDASEVEMLELALIENVQREDLNPIESAEAYQRLIREFNFTQEEISKQVGKDRTSITNYLRLLKLPDEIKEVLANGVISMGHARALLALKNTYEQKTIKNKIISKGLSVRETEKLVKKWQKVGNRVKTEIKEDIQLAAIEEELRNVFGTKVKIKHQNKKGVIWIEYYSEAELDRIIEIIRERNN